MSVIVEFHVSSPALVLDHARTAVPDVTVDVEHEIGTDPQRPLLFFWASAPPDADDPDALLTDFADAVDADDSVTDETVLDDLPDRRLYRVQCSADHDTVLYQKYVDLGAAPLSIVGTTRGWTIEMRFPDRDALSAFRSHCADQDISFSLHGLYEGVSDRQNADLTAAQRDALAVAVDAGYFAVPREATLGEVADRLGISSQAASERIRRAVASIARDAVED